jgi:hypothetical protein
MTPAHSVRPSSSSSWSTFFSMASVETELGKRIFPLNNKASRGVAVAINESSCMTYAMFLRYVTGFMTRPATQI